MTGLERTLRTLNGQKADRPPVALHNFLMAARMKNFPLDVYTRSHDLLAEAQINSWEIFGHDVLMVENGVAAMAEAIGCAVNYSPAQPPHVKEPVVKSIGDIKHMEIPDPQKAFPLNEVIKAVSAIKQRVSDKAFVMGRADQGPMALAAAIYGPQKLVMDIASNTNLRQVHLLLDFCTHCTMRYATALHQAGSDGTSIGGYGLSMISPQIFREYELPYQKMFVEHCRRENFPVGVHICGCEDLILDEMVSSGADWLELDPLTIPENACKATAGRCAVLGMIDPIGVLLTGTCQEVIEQCDYRLKQMSRTRFILGPGCALPADCPVENISAMMYATNNWST